MGEKMNSVLKIAIIIAALLVIEGLTLKYLPKLLAKIKLKKVKHEIHN